MRALGILLLTSAACLTGQESHLARPMDNIAPLYITGGEWATTVTLTNHDFAYRDVSFRAYGADGAEVSFDLPGFERRAVSRNGATQVEYVASLGPRASITVSLEPHDPSVAEIGHAVFDACLEEAACGEVSGHVLLTNRHPSRTTDLEAGYPFVSGTTRSLAIPFDQTNGQQVIVSVANPSDRTSAFAVEVFKEDGRRHWQDQMFLQPKESRLFFLAEIPGLDVRGHLRVQDMPGWTNPVVSGFRIGSTGSLTALVPVERTRP